MQSLFGTRTAADINLAAQLVLLIGLWIGFVLARRGKIWHHKNVQTAMVLANLVFIAFAMGTSFYTYVVKGGTGDRVARWMIVHGVLGTIAELAGIYLVLRMRTKVIPKRWRVRNFKQMMRATLGLWTVLVAIGLVVYTERYLTVELDFSISEKRGGTAAGPIFQLAQIGSDLNMHAAEMQDAAERGNLPTTKRHAEHLINLIEGDTGLHYGDLDANGLIEDPGDGTGALVYLRRIKEAANDPRVTELAGSLEAQITVVRDNALAITAATDIAAVSELLAETVSVARRANAEGIVSINSAAQATGMLALPYQEPAPAGTSAGGTVTILEENFGYMPYELTIDVGTTVIWINKEHAKHTVTSDDGVIESGDQELDDAFEYTFTKAGTYQYYCRFHGDKGLVGMSGIIIVE